MKRIICTNERLKKLTMRFMWTGIVLLIFALWAQAQEGTYDWTKARKLSDGIAYAQAELVFDHAMGLQCPHCKGFSPEERRRLRLHVIRIDTWNPTLHLTATGRAEDWGRPMPAHQGETYDEYIVRTKRETTAQFIRTATGARECARRLKSATGGGRSKPTSIR